MLLTITTAIVITAVLTAKVSSYMTLRVVANGGTVKGTLMSMASGRTLDDELDEIDWRRRA